MLGLGGRLSRGGGARSVMLREATGPGIGAGTEDAEFPAGRDPGCRASGRGRDDVCDCKSRGGGRVVINRRAATFEAALTTNCDARDSIGAMLGRVAALLRRSLMPPYSLTLSPTLLTPISFNAAMSRSSRTLPSISFRWNTFV